MLIVCEIYIIIEQSFTNGNFNYFSFDTLQYSLRYLTDCILYIHFNLY